MTVVSRLPLLQFSIGFTNVDLCSRCASSGQLAWLNAEHPSGRKLTPAISIYLCRDCILELLARTYSGAIDWQDAHDRALGKGVEIGPAPHDEVLYFPDGGAPAVVGLHFHTFTPDGVLHYQGRVLAQLKSDRYRVQLYSFLDGHETDRRDVDAADMASWVFYTSDRIMRWAYSNYQQVEHFTATEP